MFYCNLLTVITPAPNASGFDLSLPGTKLYAIFKQLKQIKNYDYDFVTEIFIIIIIFNFSFHIVKYLEFNHESMDKSIFLYFSSALDSSTDRFSLQIRSQ